MVGRDWAEWVIQDGPSIVVDRAAAAVLVTASSPLRVDALVHPYLAFPAAVSSYWAGRCSLHAGALAVDGKVWALVGQKEGGKSSTLGWFAQRGHSVVTDDLLIIDQGRALAGPRCIDLREEASRELGAGEELGVIGMRTRWRVRLGPIPACLPLAGWIFLSWADQLHVEPIPPGELLRRIFANRALSLIPPDPHVYLDLAALPAWEVGRPRRLDALPEVSRRILDLIQWGSETATKTAMPSATG